MTAINTKKILLIDDDEFFSKSTARILGIENYSVTYANSLKSAREVLFNKTNNTSNKFDLILLDQNLEDGLGVNFLKELKINTTDTPVVMLSSCGENDLIIESIKAGAFWFFQKNESFSNLLKLISNIFGEESKTSSPNINKEINNINDLYINPKCSTFKIFKQLEHVSNLDSTILLKGESGTGKSVFAKYTHNQSNRKDMPLVTVNCASLPSELLEAELFGYEQGAFTGANKSKLGLIESADGGTIFLDEIAEIPIELQAKLLIFLQDKTFYRLGGIKPITTDVRIITATNRDLKKMCLEKTFRQDLLFRINVLTFTIPPLRDRIESITPLAQNHLNRLQERWNKKFNLSHCAKEQLLAYNWPGNIRELENVIERAAALSNDGHIKADCLNLNEINLSKTNLNGGDLNILKQHIEIKPTTSENSVNKTLKQVEMEAIRSALINNGGSRSQAAKDLGVSERTIYNKIKNYNIKD